MPNKFDQSTIQQYGGVTWARQQVGMLDPSAIDDQIQGYTKVRESLNQIIDTLNTANSSLQSAWNGDAASAASQTFTDTSNHAQNVVSTVNNTINQLQTAKSAASTAQHAIGKVPSEVPVPHPGLFGSISNAFSDAFTGTDPVKQAQQHNEAARAQAAEVLNNLSNSYDHAASNMNSIANGDQDGGFQPSDPTPAGSFNLGKGSYGGGSGEAASYSPSFSGSTGGGVAHSPSTGGGVTNGVFDDPPTNLQGVTTLPPPETIAPTGPLNPGPTNSNPLNPVAPFPITELPDPTTETITPGPIGEEPVLDGGLSEGGGRAGGTSKLGSSNVFGEEGFGTKSGGGTAQRGSGLGTGVFEGEGAPGAGGGTVGGAANSTAGSERQSNMRPGMSRGGGGALTDEEELGSSKYSRGRYFGGDESEMADEQWVQPSIGGNESLLVKDGKPGASTGRVRSAYDGATDADGKPLNMMRGVGARRGGRDEEDERGERPGYLKEDPEWWQSAQKVAPPVVE